MSTFDLEFALQEVSSFLEAKAKTVSSNYATEGVSLMELKIAMKKILNGHILSTEDCNQLAARLHCFINGGRIYPVEAPLLAGGCRIIKINDASYDIRSASGNYTGKAPCVLLVFPPED